jgi:hypothetical protein
VRQPTATAQLYWQGKSLEENEIDNLAPGVAHGVRNLPLMGHQNTKHAGDRP